MPRHLRGLLVAAAHRAVEQRQSAGKVGGDPVESHPFGDGVDLVGLPLAFRFRAGVGDAAGDCVEEGGALRVDKDDRDGRGRRRRRREKAPPFLFLLERRGDAGEGPAGAGPADEGVDLPAGLPPDLLAGPLFVAEGVGRVLELVGEEAAAAETAAESVTGADAAADADATSLLPSFLRFRRRPRGSRPGEVDEMLGRRDRAGAHPGDAGAEGLHLREADFFKGIKIKRNKG